MRKESKIKGQTMKKVVSTTLLASMLATGAVNITPAPIPSVYALDIEYTDKEGTTHKLEDFRDTKGHWAQSTLRKWAEYEVVNGHNGNFNPNDPITRADLSVIIDRLLGLEDISYHYFQDLPTQVYYRDAILRTVAAGYIKGVSDNQLNPKGYATREEVATILSRVYKLDTVAKEQNLSHFKDRDKVSSWARGSVGMMVNEGYMQGSNGMLRPKDKITRAEVVTMLSNIADAYVPKRDVHGTGAEYKNDLSKNVVISRNITMKDSNLSKDVILTQSGRTVNLERVRVGRRILALGNSTINLNKVDVKRIELYGRSTINGLEEGTGEIHLVDVKASGTRVDVIPEKVVLAPGTEIHIEGEKFENEGTRVKTITYKEIMDARADKDGSVKDGPRISSVTIGQDLSNRITVKDLVFEEGKNEVVEVGVIEAERGTRPTIKNYTEKYEYKNKKEFYPKEKYNFTVGKVRKEKEYRVYIRDSKGLYGYSEVVKIGEYNFDTKFDVRAAKEDYTVDVELEISGGNMPEISNVKALVSDRDDAKGYKESGLSEVTTERTSETRKIYRGKIKLRPEEMTKDYGFEVNFADGNIQKEYPIKKNYNPNNYARKYEIKTGNLEETGREEVRVRENSIFTENTEVGNYGLVYKIVDKDAAVITEAGQGSGWVRVKEGDKIEQGNTRVFDSTIKIPRQGVVVYYATYGVVNGEVKYGALKTHKHDWNGDVDGPAVEYLDVQHIGGFAIINIGLKGDKLIDLERPGAITNFKGADGRPISSVNGKAIKDMDSKVVQDLWGTGKISIVIKDENLVGKGTITGELRLHTIDGKASGKYIISLNPNNEIKYKEVGRSGSKVSYAEVTGKYKNVLEIREVVSGTNMKSSVIREDGSILEIEKQSAGIESRVRVKMVYYISRSIGDVKTTEFETNLVLP